MSDIELSSSNTTERSQSGSSLIEDNQNSSNTTISASNATVNAGVIADNYTVVDTYETGSDRDTYSFEISQADSYSFSLGNLSANLDLSINDSSGNTLYSSTKSGNESESIVAEFQPGTYTATVSATTDVSTDYNFSVTKSTSNNSSEEGDAVYKFVRTDTKTELYTTSEVERDSIQANLPQYEYQGEAFVGAPNPEVSDDITGVKAVYRFFNTNTGVHLYTSSEVERDYVTNNLTNYTAEGVAYYGYEEPQEGTVPLYRLYSPTLDAHFYTPSMEERNTFIETSGYKLEGTEEGIAFYVQPPDGII